MIDVLKQLSRIIQNRGSLHKEWEYNLIADTERNFLVPVSLDLAHWILKYAHLNISRRFHFIWWGKSVQYLYVRIPAHSSFFNGVDGN